MKVFTQEVNINVKRTVVETQLKMQTRKIMLPSMSDVRKLCDYLTKESKTSVENLKQKFSPVAWMKLAEATLTSIQLLIDERQVKLKDSQLQILKHTKPLNAAIMIYFSHFLKNLRNS